MSWDVKAKLQALRIGLPLARLRRSRQMCRSGGSGRRRQAPGPPARPPPQVSIHCQQFSRPTQTFTHLLSRPTASARHHSPARGPGPETENSGESALLQLPREVAHSAAGEVAARRHPVAPMPRCLQASHPAPGMGASPKLDIEWAQLQASAGGNAITACGWLQLAYGPPRASHHSYQARCRR